MDSAGPVSAWAGQGLCRGTISLTRHCPMGRGNEAKRIHLGTTSGWIIGRPFRSWQTTRTGFQGLCPVPLAGYLLTDLQEETKKSHQIEEFGPAGRADSGRQGRECFSQCLCPGSRLVSYRQRPTEDGASQGPTVSTLLSPPYPVMGGARMP